MKKRTKIVCTIGPACESPEILVKMIEAGMNVARLNFSHGTYENHQTLFDNVRSAAKQTGQPIAIMQDLQGPKIRVGVLPEAGVNLIENENVIFDTALDTYAGEALPVDYHELHQYLKAGERLLLCDGKMETEIVSVDGTRITTKVKSGGILTSHKGINVPDSTLDVRAMSEKDKEDAKFGLSLGVDFIALSFVRTSQDIIDLRELLTREAIEKNIDNTFPVKIIAKIERREAVENIESILEVVDGIMVARGDLGLEIREEEVPVIQKKLIASALKKNKPVIVATQMLDSMQESPRPTRAEVSDVANAVIDHTDAVMLSNESAVGKYPIETVEAMEKIICEAEASDYDAVPMDYHIHKGETVNTIMQEIARLLVDRTQAQALVFANHNPQMARIMSSFRPELPIMVPARDERTLHQLNLSWGIVPIFSQALTKDAFVGEVKEHLSLPAEVVVIGSASLDAEELSVLEIVHLG